MFSSTLNCDIVLPIWKMNLSSEEVERVKMALRDSYARHGLSRPSLEDKLNAFICFAEWWRNEYSGGAAREMDVARYISLPEIGVGPLYKAAKDGLSLLRVKTIRSPKNYELSFRTMLLQGGIPKCILFGDNMSRFTQFLTKMCEELKDIAIDCWSDVSIVDSLACKYCLPKTFWKDDIYALGLEIVHAVLRDRMDLLPFDASNEEFRTLIEKLRRLIPRAKRILRPFSFTWELGIADNEGELYYTLDNLKHVSSDFLEGLDSDTYQFALEVNGKKVANYRKSNDDYVRMSQANSRTRWKGESYLNVRAVAHDLNSFALPVANNCPPDFSKPQAFNFNGSFYVQKNTDQSAQSVVIFDTVLWMAPEGCEVKSIIIERKEYAICAFHDEIVLKSLVGEEPFSVKNSFTDYFVTFRGIDVGWIESANFSLINGQPIVEVYSNEDVVTGIKKYYRGHLSRDWTELTRRTILPHGLLSIMVVFPDGKSIQREFYNVEGLSIEVIEAMAMTSTIQASCPWGMILCHKQEGVEITQRANNMWSFIRNATTPIVPERVFFTVKTPGSPDLLLSIPSPFDVFCLEDHSTGMIADDTIPISLFELDRFSILHRGAIKPVVLIKYDGDSIHGSSSATLRFTLKNHITPLSKFEAAISSIIDLHGYDPFKRDEGVSLSIGDSTYIIRPFVLDSYYSDKSVVVTGGEEGYDGTLFACEVGDNISNGELNVKPLQTTAVPNTFSLGCADNEEETRVCTPFIVFSDKYDHKRLTPRLISEETYSIKLSSKTNAWVEKLKDDDPSWGLDWRETANAFEISTDYNLPYRTFNQLRAVASCPDLFCRFLIALFFNDKQEKTFVGILRFEQEFSIAVHWIRHTVWWEEGSRFLKTSGDIKEFFEFLTEIISLTSGYPRFIGGGPSESSGQYRFSTGETNELRAASNYSLHDGAASPSKRITLYGNYIPDVIKGSMRAEQYTLIYSPLMVAEYLLGKREDLWETSDDMMETRRIISFYSREFHEVYNDILKKELQ